MCEATIVVKMGGVGREVNRIERWLSKIMVAHRG